MANHHHNLSAVRAAFYDEIRRENLAPLWTVLKGLVPPEPATSMHAAAWHYDKLRSHIMRAGELISAEEAERRVLILENPAEPGGARITRTLYAGIQLILPGEIAPCHRHTQSALRFVLEGQGAYTAVDGEKAIMSQFDLVLTPNGRWHDHGNDSDQPMVWLDGLDIPLVAAVDAGFSERLADGAQHAEAGFPGQCQALWGGNLKPARPTGKTTSLDVPLFHYTYTQWRSALRRLACSETPDPRDGVRLEFTNPADGGPVMRTISAFCQWLPPEFQTSPVQSTDGMVFVGVEGHGALEIDGRRFAIGPRDVVVAPAWRRRRIRADSELVLFSYSDKSMQEKLGLWREAACTSDVLDVNQ